MEDSKFKNATIHMGEVKVYPVGLNKHSITFVNSKEVNPNSLKGKFFIQFRPDDDHSEGEKVEIRYNFINKKGLSNVTREIVPGIFLHIKHTGFNPEDRNLMRIDFYLSKKRFSGNPKRYKLGTLARALAQNIVANESNDTGKSKFLDEETAKLFEKTLRNRFQIDGKSADPGGFINKYISKERKKRDYIEKIRDNKKTNAKKNVKDDKSVKNDHIKKANDGSEKRSQATDNNVKINKKKVNDKKNVNNNANDIVNDKKKTDVDDMKETSGLFGKSKKHDDSKRNTTPTVIVVNNDQNTKKNKKRLW